MPDRFKNSRGQFMPIAAMVVFTIVVFIVAVVNIYKVAKAKLLLQNIADAVALNLASREASSLNFIADRNEWMNHLYADSKMNKEPTATNPGCPNLSKQTVLPGLSCVQFTDSGFSFPSQSGAIGYARLVQSVNQSQQLAMQAYDTFLGAPQPTGAGVGQKALENILLEDIAALRNDRTIRLITWNTPSGQSSATQELTKAQTSAADYFSSSKSRVTPWMQGLQKAIVAHDVEIYFDGKKRLTGTPVPHAFHNKLRELLKTSAPIGWMEVDQTNQNNLPTLQMTGPGGSSVQRIGAGAIALKPVVILGVTFAVSARSEAYVVPGSGALPVTSGTSNFGQPPIFSPTYWVKLVTSHE